MKENTEHPMHQQKSSRATHIDFARGLAVLFMFTQHCMIIHEKTAGESGTILGNIFVLLGTAPAAPVFMLIMGIFAVKSRESLSQGLLRGGKILLLGSLLNLFRFTLPLLIAGTEEAIYLTEETPLSMLLAVDILQLAGLSYFFLTLLKRVPRYSFLLNSCLIVTVLVISPFLWQRNDPLWLEPLWGRGRNIYFPFFPWFLYPLLGATASDFFLKLSQKRGIVSCLAVSASCLVTGFLIFDLFPVGDYHRSGAAVHVLMIGFIFLWIPLCFVVSPFLPERVKVFFADLSKNVTPIYCIQWILFGWSILLFGANRQTDIIAAVIGLFVFLATYFLSKVKAVRSLFSWV